MKELPEDLAALDVLLSDPELLWPLVERWQREFRETGGLVLTEGRPTIALETYVRLMVLKQRYRWGYRTLVAEVSDSIHLRRFCRISAVRAGAGRVDGAQAHPADRRGDGGGDDARVDREGDAGEAVSAAGGADRLDGDRGGCEVPDRRGAGVAAGCRSLAREGRKLAKLIEEKKARVRDRSRAMGHKLRAITRTIRRRSGEAKAEVLKLTGETGELLERSIKEARRLAAVARRKARGRGAKAKLKAAAALEEMADRCEKVARQIRQRVAGEPIKDRIVSLFDPDARPIRKGKLGQAERVRVRQPAGGGDREHQARRAGSDPAGLDRARATRPRTRCCRGTVAELERLGITPREVALDGGFKAGPTNTALADLHAQDGVHRWPPATRLQAHPAPAAALPNRRGGPDQSPQTPLRAGPIPPERRRGPADLD